MLFGGGSIIELPYIKGVRIMELRTHRSRVTFTSQFFLHGFTNAMPAGEYCVEYDEEQIDGLSFTAFRRVATFIHLPSVTSGRSTTQVVEVDAAELETALAIDRAT